MPRENWVQTLGVRDVCFAREPSIPLRTTWKFIAVSTKPDTDQQPTRRTEAVMAETTTEAIQVVSATNAGGPRAEGGEVGREREEGEGSGSGSGWDEERGPEAGGGGRMEGVCPH